MLKVGRFLSFRSARSFLYRFCYFHDVSCLTKNQALKDVCSKSTAVAQVAWSRIGHFDGC